MGVCEWESGCEQTVSALRGERLCFYHDRIERGLISDVGLEPTAPARWPTVESIERDRARKRRRRDREFNRILAREAAADAFK